MSRLTGPQRDLLLRVAHQHPDGLPHRYLDGNAVRTGRSLVKRRLITVDPPYREAVAPGDARKYVLTTKGRETVRRGLAT